MENVAPSKGVHPGPEPVGHSRAGLLVLNTRGEENISYHRGGSRRARVDGQAV